MIQYPRYILSCIVDSYLIILTYDFTYLIAALQNFDYTQLPGNTIGWKESKLMMQGLDNWMQYILIYERYSALENMELM